MILQLLNIDSSRKLLSEIPSRVQRDMKFQFLAYPR